MNIQLELWFLLGEWILMDQIWEPFNIIHNLCMDIHQQVNFFLTFFFLFFFCVEFFIYFYFHFFFVLNIGDPNQLGAMYPGRAVPKLEPSETQRSSWMAPPPPRIPTHSICKIFFIFLFDFIFLKALNFDYDL